MNTNSIRNIFLIGFKYDNATNLTFPWISDNNFLASYDNANIYRFHIGSNQEKQRLKDLIGNDDPDLITVEIFLGHGQDDALLGPSQGLFQGLFKSHAPFYEMGMISTLPSSLFAYSCFSAKKFGLKYSSSQNKVFMGFMDKVFLPYEVLSELKRIFQDVAEDIVKKGKIEKFHEERFKGLITDLMENVRAGRIECESTDKLLESWLKPYLDHMQIL